MRRSLGLLIVAGLLPIVALGGIFGTLTLRAQRDQLEEQARNYARFAAALVETRLVDSADAVRAVAESPAIAAVGHDGAQLRSLSLGLLARQHMWRSLTLSDPAGHRLIAFPDSRPGAPDIAARDARSLADAVRNHRVVIGRLMADERGEFAFAVHAPVIRQGRVLAVVSAMMSVEGLRGLLLAQPIPSGWRAILVDGAGVVVATTTSGQTIARPANPIALQARRTGRTSPYRFRRADGVVSIGMFTRVGGLNWTVHVSTPNSYYAAPARRAVLLLVGAVVLCLLLFLVLARLLLAEMRATRQRDRAALQRQRMEALGQLTGGVAHDFNNLLTPIIGGHDLLRRHIENQPVALRHLDLAATAAERAKQLVARLLAFSRRQTLAPADVDVAALIDNLLEILRRSLPPAVDVEVNVPAGLPSAHADPGQLELAILNLAINARDAMPEGGRIAISAWTLEDRGSELRPGRYVAVRVADSGTGMDDATLRKAIDPFFTTKGLDRGTGLGLSMVHGFAAQSGGVLHLESRLGTGTTATILLPIGAEVIAPVAAREPDPPQPVARRRVLLVDDNAAARASTRELLQAAAHDVIEAESVDAALALLRGTTVDAIVTDYLMPDRSGAELIAAVKAGPRAVPILLITGYMGEANDVPADVPKLAKPFGAKALTRALGRLLEGERLAGDAEAA